MSAGAPENLPGSSPVRRALSVVLVALAFGALALGSAMWVHGSLARRAISERFEVPLALQAGARAETEFRTSGRYRLQVWLVVSRGAGVSDEALDQALLEGTNGPPHISWELFRGTEPCASGSSTNLPPVHFGAQQARGRLLGEFKPRGSGRFRIRLDVRRTQAGLEAARPLVRISTHLGQAKSVGIAAAIYQTLGLILVCLGAFLAGLYLLTVRRRT
jgi:hypothetical protein